MTHIHSHTRFFTLLFCTLGTMRSATTGSSKLYITTPSFFFLFQKLLLLLLLSVVCRAFYGVIQDEGQSILQESVEEPLLPGLGIKYTNIPFGLETNRPLEMKNSKSFTTKLCLSWCFTSALFFCSLFHGLPETCSAGPSSLSHTSSYPITDPYNTATVRLQRACPQWYRGPDHRVSK